MAKKITELEIASKKVESLVGITNSKITELGTHTYCLYYNLTTIQTLFDKIRNIPSDKAIEYQELKKIRLGWKNQVDKIEDDYNKAQNLNVGGGAAGTSLGVGLATLGPTAAMGIATTFGVASTGTAISALSGAAATNAALAWLGGGALAAGGGGMAAGDALLALAGPVGWTIAGLALVGSGFLYWKSLSDKKKLEQLFLLVSERDQKAYNLAIVELKERIQRIIDETAKLTTAIIKTATFGTDYNAMTEEQQYSLGTYFNFMKAATQLLVKPILGLQPKVTDQDYVKAFHYTDDKSTEEYFKNKTLVIYLAGLLYGIKFDESDFKVLINSIKKNKDFLESMKLEKKDVDKDLYPIIKEVISYVNSNK